MTHGASNLISEGPTKAIIEECAWQKSTRKIRRRADIRDVIEDEKGPYIQDADLELEIRHGVGSGGCHRHSRIGIRNQHRSAAQHLYPQGRLQISREEHAVCLQGDPAFIFGKIGAPTEFLPTAIPSVEAEEITGERYGE